MKYICLSILFFCNVITASDFKNYRNNNQNDISPKSDISSGLPSQLNSPDDYKNGLEDLELNTLMGGRCHLLFNNMLDDENNMLDDEKTTPSSVVSTLSPALLKIINIRKKNNKRYIDTLEEDTMKIDNSNNNRRIVKVKKNKESEAV